MAFTVTEPSSVMNPSPCQCLGINPRIQEIGRNQQELHGKAFILLNSSFFLDITVPGTTVANLPPG
jgi:hypothetical protein